MQEYPITFKLEMSAGAGETAVATYTFSDADFEITKMMTSRVNYLFNGKIGSVDSITFFEGMTYAGNVAGTGERPYRLDTPKLIKKGTTVTINAENLDDSETDAYLTIGGRWK